MPFFTGLSEAERYAQSRPYFHPLAIDRAKEAIGLEKDVSLALDVACGTGQSAVALTSIAKQVIGVDISWNMLANAKRNERVRYVRARAEALPFQSSLAPLMSTALAFHWFDRDQFLHEAWRVLCPKGWLLIYNNGFTGIMREELAFQSWSWEVYPERFPTPPRDNQPFTAEEAAGAGFAFIDEERYENDVRFTREELVAYLMTQTNVGAAIDQGHESLESANQWLMEQVRPYFAKSKATFVFATRAWYLRKQAIR
jgi:SAM-dependent methyltransferase